MSNSLDTILTIALFIVGGGAMIFFGAVGIFGLGLEIGPRLVQPPRFYNALGRATEVVPLLLLAGAYVAGIVLAALNRGLTFYYPLIAVPLGIAAWNWALKSLIRAVQQKRVGQKTIEDAQFEQRRQAERQLAQTGGEDQARGQEIGDAAQAIAAAASHIRNNGIDYPTTGLTADRFEAGWSVYAPVHVDDSDPESFLDMPLGRAVFLVGDSGRIEQTSSSTPPHLARQRFAEQERTRP